MCCRYSAVILLFLLHCCKRKSTPIQLSLPNPLAAPHYCNVSLIQCPATAFLHSLCNATKCSLSLYLTQTHTQTYPPTPPLSFHTHTHTLRHTHQLHLSLSLSLSPSPSLSLSLFLS